MNYEHVRGLVKKAIEIVDYRLDADVTGKPDGDSWCQLEDIKFDQTFCDDGDDHDDTQVIVHFRWNDPNTSKETYGLEDEITLYEEDMNSPYFIAGQIYAKILLREKLF